MTTKCCGSPRPSSPSGRRRKLWEVPERYMCSLIGTCLSVAEIRKLALRDELCGHDIGDYDLHGVVVAVAKVRCRTSRALHKVLERRYPIAVRRLAKLRDPLDLGQAWKESVERGEVCGPYWALLTHPHTPAALLETAFGDVHMLSHVLGATRRVDQKDHERLAADLASEQAHVEQLRLVVRARDEALAESTEHASRLEARVGRLQARLHEAREGAALRRELASLQQTVNAMQAELDERRSEAVRAERERRRLTAERDRLVEALRQAEHERAAAQEEVEAVESHLLEAAAPRRNGGEPKPALKGMRVLYVGGRTSLVPHYRDVVERQGGTFVHHDGGLEQSCAQLESLVSGAQLVICPLDAISHSSWLRVKRACLHTTCPLLPVRTASMASLVSAIRREQLVHRRGDHGLIP